MVSPVEDPEPVLLIDASIYIFRPYFALPENWHHPANGYPLNAVYGFSRWLLDLLAQQAPAGVIVAFDESLGECFRNTIYADYKSSRVLPDDALAFQLQTCKQVCQVLGLATYASKQFEADDLLASAAHACREAGRPAWVISADKDLAQLLIDGQDRLWDYDRKPALCRQGFMAERGFDPRRVAELLAITGDAVDDIPGVPGIGEKTAAALLQCYASLGQILDQPESIAHCGIRGAARVAQKIADYSEQIRLAHRLTQLREDALPDAGVEDFRWAGVTAEATPFFAENGLQALSRRLQAIGGAA